MSKALSAYFVSLVEDACLKAFWRKRALASFLIANNINKSFVEPLNMGETKANVLSNIFQSLSKNQEETKISVLLKIAHELVSMKKFIDLEDWEDSSEKIRRAKESIGELKKELEKIEINYEFAGVKSRRKEAQLAITKQSNYNAQFEKFHNSLRLIYNKVGEQSAGYEFEKWIYDFASFNDIIARPSYRDKNNRQIDGAIEIESNNIILEIKCTKCLTPVTEIDSFRAKVNTKAENTLGLIISMSGYESSAIESASENRSPIFLIDGGHLFNLVMTQRMSFKELILRVIRNGAQIGRAYLPLSDFNS